MSDVERLRAGYLEFAEHEAAGRSELYVELAAGAAQDGEPLRRLAGLPVGKRRDDVEALMLARRTQTNEPARCATLLRAAFREAVRAIAGESPRLLDLDPEPVPPSLFVIARDGAPVAWADAHGASLTWL